MIILVCSLRDMAFLEVLNRYLVNSEISDVENCIAKRVPTSCDPRGSTSCLTKVAVQRIGSGKSGGTLLTQLSASQWVIFIHTLFQMPREERQLGTSTSAMMWSPQSLRCNLLDGSKLGYTQHLGIRGLCRALPRLPGSLGPRSLQQEGSNLYFVEKRQPRNRRVTS